MDNIWKGKSVIIVDDMVKVRREFEQVYKDFGFTVVGMAGDGIEALELLETVKPDLISIDIIMPKMDGIEFFQRVQTNLVTKDYNPKYLFISYLSSEPQVIEAYKNQIDERLFIPKYFTKELLKERLEFIFDHPTLPPIAAEEESQQPAQST